MVMFEDGASKEIIKVKVTRVGPWSDRISVLIRDTRAQTFSPRAHTKEGLYEE